LRQETEVVVIGGGPGGYVAALRAADLGKDVILIEERERLGGVCLLEGCIPSKTLINAVELIDSARNAKKMGLSFDDLRVDTEALRGWTDSVVEGLSKGIDGLLERRGVEVIHGRARLEGPQSLAVDGAEVSGIDFKHCIIATGSRANELPLGKETPLWSSADALAVPRVPERLLVVGGGYIGLELGQVYAGLGSSVTVAEFSPRLLQGADPDLVKVVIKHCEKRFTSISTESKVTAVGHDGSKFVVSIEHGGETKQESFDQVLAAVGRSPNTEGIGLEDVGIKTNEKGFIEVSPEGRTSIPHIFAIGDVTPGPMLAHKASREAKVAAEVIAGELAEFDNRAIPAVVFTDPEIAWTGMTEQEAKMAGVKVDVSRFPLAALGRARTLGRTEGLAKIISNPSTGLVLGVGMVGPHASELIAEGTLALEMGASLEDLVVTIHPHPTISEAIMEAAEVAAGKAVHVHPPRKR
jgi:dihydrolipoamide dehydrogenase